MTTRELANLADVNQSTVSRCLNNHPGVSQKTKNRIIEIARKHGYFTEKNSFLRQPKDQNVIAVLLSDDFFRVYTDHFLESLFYAIFEEIDAAGFFPIIAYDKYESQGINRIEKLISGGNVAGVIIINRQYFNEVDEYLKEINIPHIYMHYFNRNSLEEINIVDMNQFVGGYLAAKHLIELGHNKILAVTSAGREFDERTFGFEKAMKDADLELADNDIITIEHNYDTAYNYTTENMKTITRYSAIFIQNDLSAIGCINALKDYGLNPPTDLSIIGYDDIDAGRFCRPSLTTIRQSVKDLSKAGVKRIIDIINSEETDLLQTFIQPKLIIRNSTTQNI